MNLAERAIAEVQQLHEFFTAWFRGSLTDDDATFERFPSVLEAEFVIIQPTATVLSRDAIVGAVRQAHGMDDVFGISITEGNARELGGGICLVTYIEKQTRTAGGSQRRCTALFREVTSAPLGVHWLHVHETSLAI